MQATGTSYVLPPTVEEEARLQRQAAFAEPYTRQFFAAAGIGPGMRVLDLGSGPGDVAMLAAELVGATGRVVGIDSNPNLLATARSRAHAAGHVNLTFVAGDLRELTLEEDFDAMVGRLILCHLEDPAAVLRRMAGSLRPGGVAAFYEVDFTVDPFSEPLVPLHQQACGWIKQACAKAGINIAMGRQLHQTFVAAGFEPPRIRVDGVAGGSRAFVEAFTVPAAETIRMLLPLLVKSGIATEDEVAIDTLAARWRDQVLEKGSLICGYPYVGAWAHRAQS
jgi:ubiquinone/menaquinone biosynthesis C-methylase UbiE